MLSCKERKFDGRLLSGAEVSSRKTRGKTKETCTAAKVSLIKSTIELNETFVGADMNELLKHPLKTVCWFPPIMINETLISFGIFIPRN